VRDDIEINGSSRICAGLPRISADPFDPFYPYAYSLRLSGLFDTLSGLP
jgi:hypothetical protein